MRVAQCTACAMLMSSLIYMLLLFLYNMPNILKNKVSKLTLI